MTITSDDLTLTVIPHNATIVVAVTGFPFIKFSYIGYTKTEAIERFLLWLKSTRQADEEVQDWDTFGKDKI